MFAYQIIGGECTQSSVQVNHCLAQAAVVSQQCPMSREMFSRSAGGGMELVPVSLVLAFCRWNFCLTRYIFRFEA